jgi:glycosyltransferase involved in cell wall biosynthesis
MYNKIIAPIIPKLADEFEGKITLTFIGVDPDLGDYAERLNYRHFPLMPLEDYRALMEKEKFDIGIMAFEKSEFGKHKYYNKFIEYSLSGVCGVYSDVEPYNLIVKDGVNGILVKDDDWVGALKRVIEDKNLRLDIVQNAQNQLRSQFSPEVVFGKLAEDLPELITYRAEKPSNFRMLRLYQIISKAMCILEKVIGLPYLIRAYGFVGFGKKLAEKIKKKVKKFAA